LRFFNSLWVLVAWVGAALKIPVVDVIVIGTDPYFSALLFPIFRFLKRSRILAHWCYDLYPEVIIAKGAKGVVRWFAQKMFSVMGHAYRSVDIMVDIGACMRRRLDCYGPRAKRCTLVPWALVEPERVTVPDRDTRRRLFGEAELALLYSGNLGVANDFSLLLALARKLNKINPRIIMCFACRGNRENELVNAVKERDTNIRFAPFAEESELEKRLSSADIHLLSLGDEWEGIVVPSKFFGSMAVGRAVIYAGPPGSAIAGWIKEFDVGLILTERNLEEIVEEVLELTKNRERLEQWQRNAYQAYRKYFSKNIVMNRWDRLLREEIENKTSRSNRPAGQSARAAFF
jgi:glycosyltransferase involved in cell wall biosynthesis